MRGRARTTLARTRTAGSSCTSRSGAVEGYAVDVAIQAEQFTLARRLMAELTAQHTGQTVERIIADGDRDRWFTASEALDYGMVDEVIASRGDERRVTV